MHILRIDYHLESSSLRAKTEIKKIQLKIIPYAFCYVFPSLALQHLNFLLKPSFQLF